MYIEYKGRLYRLIRNILYEDELIMTHFKEKTDHTFFELSDYYAKEYKANNADVKNIYEVDFYVVYHDTSKTMEMVAQRIKAAVEEGRDPEDYKDELCYPQSVGTVQLSGGRRHVKKYIWSC